jgi:hypothetical protein
MARYNPFFEKAGLRKVTETSGDETVLESVKRLETLGFKPYALSSEETNLSHIRSLELEDYETVKSILLTVSQGYYKRLKASSRAYVKREEYERFIMEASAETLAKVISRLAVLAQKKVYLIWTRCENILDPASKGA